MYFCLFIENIVLNITLWQSRQISDYKRCDRNKLKFYIKKKQIKTIFKIVRLFYATAHVRIIKINHDNKNLTKTPKKN